MGVDCQVWVDGSVGVHPNMRGHTGGSMFLGTGFIIYYLYQIETQHPEFI